MAGEPPIIYIDLDADEETIEVLNTKLSAAKWRTCVKDNPEHPFTFPVSRACPFCLTRIDKYNPAANDFQAQCKVEHGCKTCGVHFCFACLKKCKPNGNPSCSASPWEPCDGLAPEQVPVQIFRRK